MTPGKAGEKHFHIQVWLLHDWRSLDLKSRPDELSLPGLQLVAFKRSQPGNFWARLKSMLVVLIKILIASNKGVFLVRVAIGREKSYIELLTHSIYYCNEKVFKSPIGNIFFASYIIMHLLYAFLLN